ncbi:MAG: hypothetical protein AMXMBFR13_35860 [Phycisphaerae bacterium]
MREPAGWEYAIRSGKNRLYGLRTAAVLFGLACIGSIVLPFLSNVRRGHGPTACGANLRAIGAACLVYAQFHAGALPPNLATLAQGTTPLLKPEQLVCRQSGRPYVYIGAGQSNWNDPRNVIAYEPAANHGGRGANMLRLDGSSKWQNWECIVDEWAATRRRMALQAVKPPAPNGAKGRQTEEDRPCTDTSP